MTFTKNTQEWEFMNPYCRTISIELEDNKTKEGFRIETMDELVNYLAYYTFEKDYVGMYWMREAVYNVATELGCVYQNVDELESDLRRYYI